MAQPRPGSVKMLTETFRFPESTVQALLSGIHPHCPEATPFVALASLCWWRAATNRPNKVVANEHNLTVCIDFRKLMHAPPPHGFYGINEIHFSKVSVDKTHVEGGRLGQLAAAIPSHLSQHLFVYNAAFTGDQRPLHITCRVEKAEGEGLILVLPSPEEGLERTVTVTLPEEQLAKICKDEAILRPGVTLDVNDKR